MVRLKPDTTTAGPAEAGHYERQVRLKPDTTTAVRLSPKQAAVTSRAVRIRNVILFVLCLMYFIAYVDRVNISVAGSDDAAGARADAHRARAHLLGVRLSVRRACRSPAAGWRIGSARGCVLAVLSLLWAPATILTGLVLERRLARRVPHPRRRRRRRGVSYGHARADLLAAGSRARLRAGHHPQLRAPRRRGDAADRPRDRGAIRMARSRSSCSAPRAWRGRRCGWRRSGTRRRSTRGSPARSWR